VSEVGRTPWSAADPPVGSLGFATRNPRAFRHYLFVTFYRRRLPHLHADDHPVFITWRLHNSLPPNRNFSTSTMTSGQAFAAMDRLLEETRSGVFYLRQPAIADMLVAIQYNAKNLKHYDLHAFVVMPNHVHLLVTPKIELPKVTKSLKGITAKRANAILSLSASPFWQDESYDHQVRNDREFEKIRRYIEENPARAGLVRQASEYRWSSAAEPTRGSAAGQGVRPTLLSKAGSGSSKETNTCRLVKLVV
jgi:putative transposase